MPEQPQPISAAPEPDSSRVFALLLKLGMAREDAYAFVQEVQRMAAENLIARFESKLDAHAAAQDAKLEAIRSEIGAQISSIKWVLGGVASVMTLIFAAGQFGFAYREATSGPQTASTTEKASQSPAAPAPP